MSNQSFNFSNFSKGLQSKHNKTQKNKNKNKNGHMTKKCASF
jgi:hypothetical protein